MAARAGLRAAEEERVDVDVGYATRHHLREPGHLDGDLGIAMAATPGNPRGGVLLAQEEGRWICSLGGYAGDRPPLDPEGFEAYAASLPSPLLHEVIRSGVPLDEPRPSRSRASVRRRCEWLARSPRRLLVAGAAICSFDPVYGLG